VQGHRSRWLDDCGDDAGGHCCHFRRISRYVVLPAIGKDLGGDASSLLWVTNGYLLPLLAPLLLGRAFQARRALMLGFVPLALASLASHPPPICRRSSWRAWGRAWARRS
jgi:hypothetical protein